MNVCVKPVETYLFCMSRGNCRLYFLEKCTNLVVEGKTKLIVILNLTNSEKYSVEAQLSFFVKFGNR